MSFTYLGNENEGQQNSNDYSQFAPPPQQQQPQPQQFAPQEQPAQQQQQSFTYLGNENDQQAEGSTEEGKRESPIELINKYANNTLRVGSQYALGKLDKAQFLHPVGAVIGGAGIAYGMIDSDPNREFALPIPKLLSQGKQWAEKKGLKPEHFFASGYIKEGLKKTLGIDLDPKNLLEMASNWMGFVSKGKNAIDFLKNGVNKKNAAELTKIFAPAEKALSKKLSQSISPSTAAKFEESVAQKMLTKGEKVAQQLPNIKEMGRGLGAATGMQIAADNEFGPLGSMITIVAADALGGGLPGLVKGSYEFAKAPVQNTKQGLAKVSAWRAGKQAALEAQKQIIEDFKQAGIQADIGTITGNNGLKWLQNAVAQSGLTGKALDEFRTNLTNQFVGEYKNIAETLGKNIFESKAQLGEALQEALKETRNSDLAATRSIYESAAAKAGEGKLIRGSKPLETLLESISKLEEKLTPGAIKSPQQKAVLDVIKKLKSELLNPEGMSKNVSLKSLVNNKIALHDLIDYEVQGGAKQLLKGIAKDVDAAIMGYDDPIFKTLYKRANNTFAKHAKTYRNKTIQQMMFGQSTEQVAAKMNSVSNIRKIRDALGNSKEGKALFNQAAAFKMEEVIGKNMVNGVNKQLKYGTFSNILEKGENRAVIREILGEDGFRRLERLQKASGRIYETQQKFFNASQSGTHLKDAVIVGTIISDIGMALSGNPWPLVGSVAVGLGVNGTAKLMANPEFLKMVEEAILKRNSSPQVIEALSTRIANKAKEILKDRGLGAAKEISKEESPTTQ